MGDGGTPGGIFATSGPPATPPPTSALLTMLLLAVTTSPMTTGALPDSPPTISNKLLRGIHI